MKKAFYCLPIMVLLISITLYIPPPNGLPLNAWHLFGIFIVTIIALIFRPFPEPVTMLISITIASILAIPLQDLLVGYMDSILWLTITAMILSIGLKKSGLTKRIGLFLIYKFGQTSLRLGYIVSFIDLLLAISTPASPARTGGIVFPLTMGIIDACKKTSVVIPKEIASYLILLIYMISMNTGSLFLTGMAPNLINAKLAHDLLGIDISWPLWFIAALPGFIAFLAIPYITYKIHPPDLRTLNTFKAETSKKLAALGDMQRNEYITAGIFVLVLLLWSTQTLTKIDTTLVGFIGITLLLSFEIIHWKDIATESDVWSLFIWFGAILGFSSALIKSGFFAWFTTSLSTILASIHMNFYLLFILLAILSTFPHYLFASLGGYVVSLAPLLFSFIVVTDLPRYPAFFLSAFLMVISSSLTHYGNALGPMLIGTGVTSKASWWRVGLILTIFQATIYLSIGMLYWHLIGLW